MSNSPQPPPPPRRPRRDQRPPTPSPCRFIVGAITDVGMVRETNQDSYLVDDPLFVVADGMGGHKGGEIASAIAIDTLRAAFNKSGTTADLRAAAQRANAKVWEKSQLDENLRGMGTTLTGIACVKNAEDVLVIAAFNIGDSRTYCMRNGEFIQLTRDHSFVEEMVQAGELTHEEAEVHPRRNVLTRALGVDPDVEVDINEYPITPGDRFLICSDGLTKELSDSQIAASLRRLRDPNEAASDLTHQAKSSGGHDNITIIIVDVVDPQAQRDPRRQTPPTHTRTVPATNDPRTPSRPETKPARKHDTRESVDNADETVPTKRTSSVRLTFRILAFFLLMAALLGAGVYSVYWYARSSYFIKSEGEAIVLYRGQPEKVLWLEPERLETLEPTTKQIPEHALAQLATGKKIASPNQARSYLKNLTDEKSAYDAASGTTTTAPPEPPAPDTPTPAPPTAAPSEVQ